MPDSRQSFASQSRKRKSFAKRKRPFFALTPRGRTLLKKRSKTIAQSKCEHPDKSKFEYFQKFFDNYVENSIEICYNSKVNTLLEVIMLLSTLLQKIEYTDSFTDCEVNHITNDSREVKCDSIFVCIKGFATDGHLFAKKAYDNGCRVFVCEYTPDRLPDDATIICVNDSRIALATLSKELYKNPSNELIVIGITGTKGKTTTALMIKQLLDKSDIPTGYIGSNGILFGNVKIEATNTTPESYKLQYFMRKMADSGIKAVVMEVSSQALKFNRVLGIKFDITLFSNLSPDHIGPGEHDNFDEYFACKKQLFDKFESKITIANADDEYTNKILADCKNAKMYYSIDATSDVKATNIKLCRSEKILGMSFVCHIDDKEIPCSLSIPGEFNIHNTLATLSVAKSLDIDINYATKIISTMNIDGRFETIVSENGACFVIDYAHNGLSLKSALMALRKYEPTRLICLFGSVGCRTQVRRAQMGAVASEYADFSILTSDNPNTEDPQAIINEIAVQYKNPSSYISIPDRKEAIEYALENSISGDIILLAGKGHERYQLINGKNIYFCEREIIENNINAKSNKILRK